MGESEYRMFNGKRGQSIILDLFTALFVFLIVFIAIILLFNFYSNRLRDEIFRGELRDKAFMLGEIILSTGKPVDWTASNVEIIGLTTHDRHITQARFNELKDNIAYADAKDLFGLGGFDFYLRLLEIDGEIIGEYGNDIDLRGKEVVSLRRIVFYEGQAARLDVRVWRAPIIG